MPNYLRGTRTRRRSEPRRRRHRRQRSRRHETVAIPARCWCHRHLGRRSTPSATTNEPPSVAPENCSRSSPMRGQRHDESRRRRDRRRVGCRAVDLRAPHPPRTDAWRYSTSTATRPSEPPVTSRAGGADAIAGQVDVVRQIVPSMRSFDKVRDELGPIEILDHERGSLRVRSLPRSSRSSSGQRTMAVNHHRDVQLSPVSDARTWSRRGGAGSSRSPRQRADRLATPGALLRDRKAA